MIDEVPLMALVLSLAQGESYIGGLMELRLKETDRLEAIASELNKTGADIRVKCDALIIRGVKKLKGARLNSYGDHRMAMMLIMAGILSGEDFSVKDCGCVSVSNPAFFDDLRKIGFRFHI
jgi:3-phosphoshikimate 1-carboxyvinyltransferase